MMNKYSWLNDFLLENKGSEKDFKEECQWDRYIVADKMFAAICKPDEKYNKGQFTVICTNHTKIDIFILQAFW